LGNTCWIGRRACFYCGHRLVKGLCVGPRRRGYAERPQARKENMRSLLLILAFMKLTILWAETARFPRYIKIPCSLSGSGYAEYFKYRERETLIIYDDLSKQAQAYRQMSLTLRRPPGRELIERCFDLHSRLWEETRD
ncbi:hypothetical protein HAX54_044937, partial [Datura stramonium]|nr:hypothetical protein [Datura stramonium]